MSKVDESLDFADLGGELAAEKPPEFTSHLSGRLHHPGQLLKRR